MDENIGDLNIAWSGLAGELILTSGSKWEGWHEFFEGNFSIMIVIEHSENVFCFVLSHRAHAWHNKENKNNFKRHKKNIKHFEK